MTKVASLILLTFIVISSYFFVSVLGRSTIEYNRDATVYVNADNMKWIGSGVHLGNGYILSANHVTSKAKEYAVSTFTSPKNFRSAEVVAFDETNDISVIKTEDAAVKNLPEVTIDCNMPKLGEDVYNIGHSWHNQWVTFYGKIAATNHHIIEDKTYAINISNTQGSSGGGFFDSRGHLIGVVSQYMGGQVPGTEHITISMHYPARPIDICKLLDDNQILYNQPLISEMIAYINGVEKRIRYAGISGWWLRT